MSALSLTSIGADVATNETDIINPFIRTDFLKSRIANLGAAAAAMLGDRLTTEGRVLLIGCGVDFDEFCTPIVEMLVQHSIEFHVRCYWPENFYNATVDGEDITTIVQDFAEGKSETYDAAIIATSLVPSAEFLRAFLVRLSQFEDYDRRFVVAGLISGAAVRLLNEDYSSVDLVSVSVLPPYGTRPIRVDYTRFEDRLARNRRYFRHMPVSIESIMTGAETSLIERFTNAFRP